MNRVYVRGTAAHRFAAHLRAEQRAEGMSPCMEWQGSQDRKGYGRFNAGTGDQPRYVLAHRFAAELAGVLDGRPLMHRCDNPPCCNVDHLVPGSLAENNADMRAKGRHAHGERAGQARLTDLAVLDIRRRCHGESLKALAVEYGVAYRTVVDVVNGVTWRHVVSPCVEVDEHGREVTP